MKSAILRLLFSVSLVLYAEVNHAGTILKTTPIVSLGNKQETITVEELREIFTAGIVRWKDSFQPITIIMMPQRSTAHKEFLKNVLNINLSYQERLLNRNRGSERMRSPIVVNNRLEMIKEVAKHKGAIGYINGYLFVNTDSLTGVRVIEVVERIANE